MADSFLPFRYATGRYGILRNLTLTKTWIPFSWLAPMRQAGLTPAERLVVVYAGTSAFRSATGVWLMPWSTKDLCDRSGVEIKVVSRAKGKMLAAGLFVLEQPAAKSLKRAEVFDISALEDKE